MKKHNSLDERKKELVNTGLCFTFDFIPEKKTSFKDYTFDFAMDTGAKAVMQKAFDVLNLVPIECERIERITKAIMALDYKNTAEACHIAEAIQYLTDNRC